MAVLQLISRSTSLVADHAQQDDSDDTVHWLFCGDLATAVNDLVLRTAFGAFSSLVCVWPRRCH